MYKILITLIFLFTFLSNVYCQDIKNVDLAGTWYSSNPDKLRKQLDDYFIEANPTEIKGEIIGIISPHAGMIYSGEVAAYGFKAVKNKKINLVVVIGFSHKKEYDGIAVFDEKGVKTPLGILLTDKELTNKILSMNEKFFSDSSVFDKENSVELILPFIQYAMKDPKVILLAIGNQSFENSRILGDALYELLKNRKDYLLVASTDMSHYLSAAEAEQSDKITSDRILKMHPEELHSKSYRQNKMCGTGAVVATMIAAKKLGANKSYILDVSNSSKISGDYNRVVGYLSAAFVKEDIKSIKGELKMDDLVTVEQKTKLLKIARDTISCYLKTKKTLKTKIDDTELKKVMGVFVTLHKNGQLRGCIGNIIGRQPLYLGVIDMAIASATQDPRFSSVTLEELKGIDIEISVLSSLEKIDNADKIILGKHGVLVKDHFRSGVYLPQVAIETGWTKEEFMNSLCGQKAGMDTDAWKKGKCQIYIYTAEVFDESLIK